MTLERNKKNSGIIDKNTLMEELAIDIANKFGFEKQKAELLIKKETLAGIDTLKNELEKKNISDKQLSPKELENLFFTLKGALEIIENSSKIEIKSLKEDIEKTTINIEEFKNKLEEYLPPKLVNRAKNPNLPHEHILGFALGTTNSILATVEALYNIGKGIILAPYHLYLILSGKAYTDSFKDI